MKLVEKEKNALEAEKNTAVEFLSLENDFFLHKNQLCQYRVWVFHNQINSKCVISLNQMSLWQNHSDGEQPV